MLILGRTQKQQQSREIFENKLMGFEDYTHTIEGLNRINKFYEHLSMETEDELSYQQELVIR